MRHDRHRRGRPTRRAAPRQGASAVIRLRLPEGHRVRRGAQRSRPRHADAAHWPERIRTGHLGRGDSRHRSQALRHPAQTRLRRDRLVHGQPRSVQLLAPGVVAVVRQGLGPQHPLLHGIVAGHQQPPHRQPAAVRHPHIGTDTRPHANGPSRHDGRQPCCLPWQLPDRPSNQGPDARHRQARRTSRGDRPAQDGDGRSVRVARNRPRRRFLPAAVATTRAVR